MWDKKSFISKVHNYFDELNYNPIDFPNYKDFIKSATRSLNRTKTFKDSKNATEMILYCSQNWEKIEQTYKTDKDVYKSYYYEGQTILQSINENDAKGSTYFTDIPVLDNNSIMSSSVNTRDNILYFNYDVNKITFDKILGINYYAILSQRQNNLLKIYNDENIVELSVNMDTSNNVFIVENNTNLKIENNNDNSITIEIEDEKQSDKTQKIATINYDTLSVTNKYGLSKLMVYDNNNKYIYLIMLLAASIISLIKQNKNNVLTNKDIEEKADTNNSNLKTQQAFVNKLVKYIKKWIFITAYILLFIPVALFIVVGFVPHGKTYTYNDSILGVELTVKYTFKDDTCVQTTSYASQFQEYTFDYRISEGKLFLAIGSEWVYEGTISSTKIDARYILEDGTVMRCVLTCKGFNAMQIIAIILVVLLLIIEIISITLLILDKKGKLPTVSVDKNNV